MSAAAISPSARPLRIGIDGRELEGRPTGVGRYLRSLLRRFASSRHHFILYSASPVALPQEWPSVERRVLAGGHPLIWEQRTLSAALAADAIDVLLSPAYSCPLFTRVPRVTAIHDLSFFARREEFGFVHGLRRRLMARGAARVSRSILACSQFTKTEVRRHLGAQASNKTVVVALGPDDDLPASPRRSESRAALSIEGDTAYVVTVGTVLRRRHVTTLVHAVKNLRDRGLDVRLGVIGENRSHPYEDIGALAQSLSCEASVFCSGFVTDEEVVRHYAAADVAVFLSDYEGFGLPALEALSRGVPTLVADRGSLNEMFAPGAMVVEPQVSAVTEALGRVLTDKEVAADLRLRGRKRASQFSWERAARETLDVLEKAAVA